MLIYNACYRIPVLYTTGEIFENMLQLKRLIWLIFRGNYE